MGSLKSHINFVFGISFDSMNGLAMEFNGCPEAIPLLQDRIQGDFRNMDRISMSLLFEDVLLKAIKVLKPVAKPESRNLVDQYFGQNLFIGCANSKAELVIQYLTSTLARCKEIKQQAIYRNYLQTNMRCLYERIQVTTVLFLRGLTNSGCTYEEVSTNYLRFLLQNVDNLFDKIVDILNCCTNLKLVDLNALEEVFQPVLDRLRTCALMVRLSKENNALILIAERIFKILDYLLSGKIVDLVVSRFDFSPIVSNGFTFCRSSFLGPFLSLTIGQIQSRDLCFDDVENLFTIDDPNEIAKSAEFSIYRTQISSLRIELHSVFFSLLSNSGSRGATLDYICKMIEMNRKLLQIHANHDELVSSTAMIQLSSLMLDLSNKIQVEKVQDDYIFHKDCRIFIKNEARINMDSDQIEAYSRAISKDVTYVPSFNTECFYITIDAVGVGVLSIYNSLKNLRRELLYVEEHIKKLKEQLRKAGDSFLSARMQKALSMATKAAERMISSVQCYECLLYDPIIIEKSANFLNKFLHLLLRSVITNVPNRPGGDESYNIERFMSYPDRYLETIIEFFIILFKKDRGLRNNLDFLKYDLPRHLSTLLTNLSLIKNPHLGSKLVDLAFLLCPSMNPVCYPYFSQMIENEEAKNKLFFSLVKFYADVETTGATSEFYDKFNIRRNLQILFKCMWANNTQRIRMMEVARESSQNFIRFISMVINDTTFLLDESLAGLKKIHEIENEILDERNWNKLAEDERKYKQDALAQAKGQVTIWLQLGNHTIELFVDLTHSAPDVFTQEALGERVASMLNYNLVQLCGPKCAELKVKDAKKRFQWDPKDLTQKIIQIYTNLAGNVFAKQVAEDERSYSPDIFAAIVETLRDKVRLSTNMLEMFQNFCERVEYSWQEKTQNEEDFGDDIPDEFRDAIIYTVMRDPVMLPSGQVVDRKNILRHLLSDQTNPFTRQPLTVDQLIPDDGLKRRIDSWIKELRLARRRN